MHLVLREAIISSYSEVMSSYLDSDDHKVPVWEFTNLYYEFRDRLPEDMQNQLDELFYANDEIHEATASEAFYRGFLAREECHDSIKK